MIEIFENLSENNIVQNMVFNTVKNGKNLIYSILKIWKTLFLECWQKLLGFNNSSCFS